jgi:hypothetical protein
MGNPNLRESFSESVSGCIVHFRRYFAGTTALSHEHPGKYPLARSFLRCENYKSSQLVELLFVIYSSSSVFSEKADGRRKVLRAVTCDLTKRYYCYQNTSKVLFNLQGHQLSVSVLGAVNMESTPVFPTEAALSAAMSSLHTQ